MFLPCLGHFLVYISSIVLLLMPFGCFRRRPTGKTHIAKRICRFLSFFHDIPSQIYNVGDYRRQLFGDFLP